MFVFIFSDPNSRHVISEATGRIFNKFSKLADAWEGLISRSFILRSLKGRFHHRASTGGKLVQLASSLVQGKEEIHPQGGDFPQIYMGLTHTYFISHSFLAHGSRVHVIRPRCPKIFDVRTSLQ